MNNPARIYPGQIRFCLSKSARIHATPSMIGEKYIGDLAGYAFVVTVVESSDSSLVTSAELVDVLVVASNGLSGWLHWVGEEWTTRRFTLVHPKESIFETKNLSLCIH